MSYLVSGIKEFLGPTVIQNDNTADTPLTIKGDTGTSVLTVSNAGNVAVSGTLTTTGASTANGNVTIASGKTLAVTTADKLTVGGNVIANTITETFCMAANGSLANQAFFIADRAYTVTSASEVHSAAGTNGGAVTIDITKETTTGAPASGNTVLSATFDAKGTANTVQTKTPSATGADILMAAGDRLSVKFTGTLTTLAGVVVTVSLKAT